MALSASEVVLGTIGRIKMTFATLFFILAFLLSLHFTATRLAERMSITLLLMGGLLLIHGVPMLIYLHITGPDTFIYEKILDLVNQEEIIEHLLLAMGIVFLCVPAGIRFTLWLWPTQWTTDEYLATWSDGGLRRVYQATPSVRRCLWLVVLIILAVIFIEEQPQKIIEYFLQGGSEYDNLILRVDGGGTPHYIYNVFLYSIAPFVVLVLWSLRSALPADPHIKILFYVFLAVILIGKLGTLSKLPLVFLLLQLTLLIIIILQARIRTIDVLATILIATILFSLVVNLTIPDLDIMGIFRFLYYRIFDIPNEVLIEYFSAFPYSLPHTWEYGVFGTLISPSGEVPLQNYFAVAELSRGSVLSSSNAMFLGDAWADYGWLGVVSFPFFAGVAVQSVDLYAARLGRTDEWACITAGCSFAVLTMLSTGLTTAFLTGGLALIPLVSILFLKPAAERCSRVHDDQEQVPS